MSLPGVMSRWPEYWRELYEERAAMREYHGGETREAAEIFAEDEVRELFDQQRGCAGRPEQQRGE